MKKGSSVTPGPRRGLRVVGVRLKVLKKGKSIHRRRKEVSESCERETSRRVSYDHKDFSVRASPCTKRTDVVGRTETEYLFIKFMCY